MRFFVVSLAQCQRQREKIPLLRNSRDPLLPISCKSEKFYFIQSGSMKEILDSVIMYRKFFNRRLFWIKDSIRRLKKSWKFELLFSKNWQKSKYKTGPKVQKLNTRLASIEEFTVHKEPQKHETHTMSKGIFLEFFSYYRVSHFIFLYFELQLFHHRNNFLMFKIRFHILQT